MTTPLLRTKLHIPPTRPELVSRPRLIERLNAGLPRQGGSGEPQGFSRKLTLASAPAGFGKTTLLSEWVHHLAGATPPVSTAWLSLDEGDNDRTRFLAYFVAALQTLDLPAREIGKGASGMLRTPQPPPTEAVMTALINEVAAIPAPVVLVLDDAHVIEAQAIHDALAFLLQHLPPQMHLVIATREDPPLPLARLRARSQLTELRVADLRFTPSEAAEFLNRVMGLDLSAEDVAALERRTEGWIAGLQLAAISMQGREDIPGFIASFTGSHHFVLDYLVEEVLEQQPETVQAFLLQTSILDRMCGPLCDAVRFGYAETRSTARADGAQPGPAQSPNGQAILEMLERANLFVVPLDNERRWYRYHHLFADLLRQRLQRSPPPLSSPPLGGTEGGALPLGGTERGLVAQLHVRASQWYEDNGLEIEAFQHAAAANDVERAARLVEGKEMPGRPRMPLQFRGAVAPVLNWLESLPTTVLDTRPSLWVMYASALSMTGQLTGVEQKLQAAEAALQGVGPDDTTRNLVGHIAAIRALLAAAQNQAETIIAQSRRALEYLHPDNLAVRTATTWKLGWAYQLQGDRAAASRAYTEAIAVSQASGNTIINISATVGLGNVQEAENQLPLAAQTYRRVLQLVGEPPLPIASEAHLGLARISYQWNDLDAAERHGRQAVQLAREYGDNIDRFVSCEVFLARLTLARGEVAKAAAMLAETDQVVRGHSFAQRLPEVAAAQVRTLLRQGNVEAAVDLAEAHELPLSQVRVYLARGDTGKALAVLEPWRHQAEAKGWKDDTLKGKVLQAVALHLAALQVDGEAEKAVHVLGEALALAKPGGFVRLFVDEGRPMARLLYEALSRGVEPEYVGKLLAAFEEATVEEGRRTESAPPPTGIRPPSPARSKAEELIEPLSEREVEVLQHIAAGLTNQEVADRLFISIHTVKVHARNIYGKLSVSNRTQAVARGKALGILQEQPF